MRARIIGMTEVFEVIAEEFSIPGSPERFIVHMTIDYMRKPYIATHLETSQIIGEGDTIDEAIKNGTEKWQAAAPEEIAARLNERRDWVAGRMVELGVKP